MEFLEKSVRIAHPKRLICLFFCLSLVEIAVVILSPTLATNFAAFTKCADVKISKIATGPEDISRPDQQ